MIYRWGKGYVNRGQRLFTDTEKVRTKMLVFNSGYNNMPTLFRNLQKEIFSLQGALPTMIHGQAFRIITSQLHHRKGSFLSSTHWVALWIWTFGTFTNTNRRIDIASLHLSGISQLAFGTVLQVQYCLLFFILFRHALLY